LTDLVSHDLKIYPRRGTGKGSTGSLERTRRSVGGGVARKITRVSAVASREKKKMLGGQRVDGLNRDSNLTSVYRDSTVMNKGRKRNSTPTAPMRWTTEKD